MSHHVPVALDEIEAVGVEGALAEAVLAGGIGEGDRFTPCDRLLQSRELFPRSAGILIRGQSHRQLLDLGIHGLVPAPQDRGQGQAEGPGVREAAVQRGQGQGQGPCLRW